MARRCVVAILSPLLSRNSGGGGQRSLKLSRRDFLKLSGVSAATAGALAVGTGAALAEHANGLRIVGAKEVLGVCPFCSVGCGTVSHVKNGQLIHIEGNIEHPISEGSLCPKGASTFQFAYNENRVARAMYRAPNSDSWQEISLTEALDRIAQRTKETRDQHLIATEDGVTVNRLDAIAHIGSACIDNEENYALVKLMRSLGVSYLEHHARI